MREKLIELIDKAEEQAGKRCDFAENCDQCPADNQSIDCFEWLMADCLIANGVTTQKWIPVTERLPENMDDRVLVLLPNPHDYPIGNQRIDTDRYRGEYRKWVRYGDGVTHWMPLPEPPSGERGTDGTCK